MGMIFLGQQLVGSRRTHSRSTAVGVSADISRRVSTADGGAVAVRQHRGRLVVVKRRGVVTGRRLGSAWCRWVDADAPIELIWQNHRPPRGIITHNLDRFTCDDVVEINGMAVATIQRTALDLGRFLPRGAAVEHLDALARATGTGKPITSCRSSMNSAVPMACVGAAKPWP